jgi:hypothetical protein
MGLNGGSVATDSDSTLYLKEFWKERVKERSNFWCVKVSGFNFVIKFSRVLRAGFIYVVGGVNIRHFTVWYGTVQHSKDDIY